MANITALASLGASAHRTELGMWATRMAAGKLGGAAGMNLCTDLFDVESTAAANAYHNAGVYTINPNLWCAPLLPHLSCVVIAKDDCGTSTLPAGQAWRRRYGGVAITPQHVLYCSHAFTHAQGTWSAYNGNTGSTPPTRLRFRGDDGVIVDRVQIHQAAAGSGYSNAANDFGANVVDWCVAVLDTPLPATIRIPKIIWSGESLIYESVGISQEWSPTSGDEPLATSPLFDNYPRHNRQMVYINTWRSPTVSTFRYSVWSGDSGTPQFAYTGSELVLYAMAGVAAGLATIVGGYTPEARLNAMIGVADASAVAAGRLVAPTGLTVTVAEHPLTP